MFLGFLCNRGHTWPDGSVGKWLYSRSSRRRLLHVFSAFTASRAGGCIAAPKTATDLRELLAESIIEIRAGKLDPRVANALGYLGASYLRALEVSDVESRLDALEGVQRAQERAILQPNSPDDPYKGGL